MAIKHPDLDQHFTPPATWAGELAALRAILHDTTLIETLKWNSPVYSWDNRNVAILWGFKEAATLGFFKGVLLNDPDKHLQAHGPNSRSSLSLKFHDTASVHAAEPLIRDFVAQAIQLEKDGKQVPKPDGDPDWPPELEDRLDADPALREAFEALTPGRRRGYILHIAGARQSKTRHARIDKHAPRILQGKGMHDDP